MHSDHEKANAMTQSDWTRLEQMSLDWSRSNSYTNKITDSLNSRIINLTIGETFSL